MFFRLRFFFLFEEHRPPCQKEKIVLLSTNILHLEPALQPISIWWGVPKGMTHPLVRAGEFKLAVWIRID